jgi:hypothetical protein
MRFSFLKMIMLVVSALALYQYRYRILNLLLGMKLVRSFVVGRAFRIPGLREKVLHNVFQ